MAWELGVTAPDGSSRTLKLDGERARLGRAPENELAFPDDAGLSRQHVLFERYGDDWLVRDLLSKNGTFVNGARISEPVKLHAGDRITASRVTIVASPGADTPAPEAEPAAIAFATRLYQAISSTSSASPAQAVPGWRRPIDALVHAGRELAGRRPVAELFEILLDLAIESVGAQRGALVTTDAAGDTLRAQRGKPFSISRTVRQRVLESKDSVLVRDALADSAFRGSASIIMQGVRTLMAAPLQTDERVIGLIYVDTPQRGREFSADDLNLLTVLANVAAIRIERERLMEIEQLEQIHARELKQAAEIQMRLIPSTAPAVEGFNVAGFTSPCRTVGGDYYDFVPYAEGQLGLIVADVAGKGLPASLMMCNLQARVQANTETLMKPAEVVVRLNRGMARTCPGNRFVTLFFAIADPKTGELAYSNAGHNPPLIVRCSGEVERLEAGGPVLGVLPMAAFAEGRSAMQPGDALVMYSDGVTEASNLAGDEFGEERLVELVQRIGAASAEDLVRQVHGAVCEFAAGAPQADDITVVAAVRT